MSRARVISLLLALFGAVAVVLAVAGNDREAAPLAGAVSAFIFGWGCGYLWRGGQD